MVRIGSMVLREYSLGCSLRDLWWKYEYWEILGLLYSSLDWQQQQVDAQKEAKKKVEIERKAKSGNLKTYYKPKSFHKRK